VLTYKVGESNSNAFGVQIPLSNRSINFKKAAPLPKIGLDS
jgi:hypothetical protein